MTIAILTRTELSESMSAGCSSIENMFEEFDQFGSLVAAIPPDATEAALVTRIAQLEKLKAAAAAGQARAAAALDASRREAEAAAGVPAHNRGRGVGAEVALARSDSPVRGGRHLGFAKALVHEMPRTLSALERGVLSEWRATILVRESACLDIDHRRLLDAELCGDDVNLIGVGDSRLAAAARAIAYRLDPHAVVDRASKARGDRCVTIRPAPDTMAYLTALLPVAEGVAVYAALKRVADTNADARSRGQVMADALVERVTGRSVADPMPVAVNLVISDEALLSGSSKPAVISDYGPIPAEIARQMVCNAAFDSKSRATLRRLYASPKSGALVALESRRRIFPRGLATLIELRDQRCRTPYCDAPVRHRDHAVPHRSGGPTSAGNGLGLCEQCNYVKESGGWRVSADAVGAGRHTADFTTPTGAGYRSTAPPVLPGNRGLDFSYVEVALAIAYDERHAA